MLFSQKFIKLIDILNEKNAAPNFVGGGPVNSERVVYNDVIPDCLDICITTRDIGFIPIGCGSDQTAGLLLTNLFYQCITPNPD